MVGARCWRGAGALCLVVLMAACGPSKDTIKSNAQVELVVGGAPAQELRPGQGAMTSSTVICDGRPAWALQSLGAGQPSDWGRLELTGSNDRSANVNSPARLYTTASALLVLSTEDKLDLVFRQINMAGHCASADTEALRFADLVRIEVFAHGAPPTPPPVNDTPDQPPHTTPGPITLITGEHERTISASMLRSWQNLYIATPSPAPDGFRENDPVLDFRAVIGRLTEGIPIMGATIEGSGPGPLVVPPALMGGSRPLLYFHLSSDGHLNFGAEPGTFARPVLEVRRIRLDIGDPSTGP